MKQTKSFIRIAGGAAAAGAMLLGAARLGLRLRPQPFPAYPQPTPKLEYVPLPDHLPPKVNEHFLDGQARMELPVGVIENEPKVDMAANLALWGESVWFPSILATDPRVRWEALDDAIARLAIPFGAEEDTFTVTFDPGTGLIRRMEALRYREATDVVKIPWRIEPLS